MSGVAFVCQYEYGYSGSEVKAVFTKEEDAKLWVKEKDGNCEGDSECERWYIEVPLDPEVKEVVEEQGQERDIVDLWSLVGEHWLSGAGYGEEIPDVGGWSDGMCSVFQLVLDGRQYDFVEDPDDGYRSYLGGVFVSDEITVDNTFPPVKVYIRDEPEKLDEDIIYGYSEENKVIFAVGTENTDDYYPYYVGEWHPEEMPQGGV